VKWTSQSPSKRLHKASGYVPQKAKNAPRGDYSAVVKQVLGCSPPNKRQGIDGIYSCKNVSKLQDDCTSNGCTGSRLSFPKLKKSPGGNKFWYCEVHSRMFCMKQRTGNQRNISCKEYIKVAGQSPSKQGHNNGSYIQKTSKTRPRGRDCADGRPIPRHLMLCQRKGGKSKEYIVLRFYKSYRAIVQQTGTQ
jgi:hypothetical protein